jgi:hypothetical protein
MAFKHEDTESGCGTSRETGVMRFEAPILSLLAVAGPE